MDLAELPDSRACARICALAFETQQLLNPWLADNAWIEHDYVGPVISAYAFAWPWLTPDQLARCVQFELWVFGADKLIDTDATTREEVVGLVTDWTHIAEGGAASESDGPGRALAVIRAQLTESDSWPALGHRWQRLFRRSFEGMLEEWECAASLESGGPTPTFDEYIANSDSCGFRIIRLTDWIASAEPGAVDSYDQLITAAWHAEISSRLTNDLRTYERERDQIDLNALKLGCTADDIGERIKGANRSVAELIDPLTRASVGSAIALERILDFGNGFYELADFRVTPADSRKS